MNDLEKLSKHDLPCAALPTLVDRGIDDRLGRRIYRQANRGLQAYSSCMIERRGKRVHHWLRFSTLLSEYLCSNWSNTLFRKPLREYTEYVRDNTQGLPPGSLFLDSIKHMSDKLE
jgi:hypothetical protein